MCRRKPRHLFRLTLAVLPSDVPSYQRLKRLLKCLLRQYDFRAEKLEELFLTSPAGARNDDEPPEHVSADTAGGTGEK